MMKFLLQEFSFAFAQQHTKGRGMYAFKDLLLLLQVLQAFSDALYASPGIFSAGTFARKSKNTYFYHFSHHSKVGPYGQVSDDYRCYFLRGIVSFCRKIPVFFSVANLYM